MVSEAEPADWNSPTLVTGEWVTVERAIDRKKGDVIATLEITATGDVPVSVEVIDEFPEDWSVEEVGIHPEFEPDQVIAKSNRFEFADTVAPESPLEVVYGARIDAPDTISPPNLPIIQLERPLEIRPHPAGDLATKDRGLLSRDSSEGPDVGVVDRADPADRFRTADRDTEGDRGLADRMASLTQSLSEEDGSTPTADGEAETFTFETDRHGEPATDDSLVAKLADELDSERASDEAVAKLKDALGLAGSKREEVRVKHLQSRVEEFAAYADELGNFLDERGPLVEVLDDQQARLDDLEGDLDTVQTTVDTADDERAALREQLDDATARIGAVEGLSEDLDSVQDELGQLRHDLGEDLDGLEAALDSHQASISAAVDRLTADLEALETQVENWNATRRHLADALTPESEPQQDD